MGNSLQLQSLSAITLCYFTTSSATNTSYNPFVATWSSRIDAAQPILTPLSIIFLKFWVSIWFLFVNPNSFSAVLLPGQSGHPSLEGCLYHLFWAMSSMSKSTMEEQPSIPTPNFSQLQHSTSPSMTRTFPYAPPQQQKSLQDQLSQ